MFFILGYPKSRTTWLSCFLHDSSHPCFHEKSSEFGSFEEMERWCEENSSSGIIDTLLVSMYEKLLSITDKVVVIARNPNEVKLSLSKEGMEENSIDYLIPHMKKAVNDKRIMVIKYEDLDNTFEVRRLCEHIGILFDEDKYRMFSECIISTDIEAFIDRVNSSNINFNWIFEK